MSDEPRPSRTERADFQATSDPALQESADRGEAKLLDLPRAVPAVGAPAVGDAGPRLHAGPDRLARAHRRPTSASSACTGCRRSSSASSGSPPSSGRSCAPRPTRTCGSSCARRSPTRRATSRSSTASTPRSACSRPTACRRGCEETSEHLNPEFETLFDEMLHARVDRLAVEPEDLEALVEAITIYHMVIEGMLALTGQHFIIDFNERVGTLPGFVEGFTNVARDEHRHVAFGARFLRDMAREDPRYARGDPAHAGRGRAGRRRRAQAEVDRGRARRRADAVRRRRSTRRARSRCRRWSAG